MNRSISDWYTASLPAQRQGEMQHRYVLGLYELLDKLTSAFPEILFEGCCGGGGRFDAGIMHYCPQIWCSDDTDAYERTIIQYGTSFSIPYRQSAPMCQLFRIIKQAGLLRLKPEQ